MAKLNDEQKAAIAETIFTAVESGDHAALGNGVAAAVVANNPKLGPWGSLMGAAIGAAIKRFMGDYGADAEGAKAPWWRRMLPW